MRTMILLALLLVAPGAARAAVDEAAAKSIAQALVAENELSLKAWTELAASVAKPDACDVVHKAIGASLKAIFESAKAAVTARKKLMGTASPDTVERAQELSQPRVDAIASQLSRVQDQAAEKLAAFLERCPKLAAPLGAEIERLGELSKPD